MANRTVRSLVSAVAAAASFALAPTAQAALYYQSDFDPFSFILKAIFEIDEDCLSPANTWVPNSTPMQRFDDQRRGDRELTTPPGPPRQMARPT